MIEAPVRQPVKEPVKGLVKGLVRERVTEIPTRAPKRTHRKVEESGRITPREVIDAYEEEGIFPVRQLFSNADGSRMCPASVLALHEGLVMHGKQILYKGFFASRFSSEPFEVAASYREGFIAGVDKPERTDLEDHVMWRKGFRDGARAWRFAEARFGLTK